MKIYLSILISLFLIIKPVLAAPNACDRLIQVFGANREGVKIGQVKLFMDKCLIESRDDNYIDTVPAADNDYGSKPISNTVACKPSGPQPFNIISKIKAGTVKIREKTSTKDLTQFMKDSGQDFDTEFQKFHTQGLMYGNLGIKIEPEIVSISTPSSIGRAQFCQYISNVHYEAGYDDLLVYVSKDTPKQSCEYYFTLRHELIHASISRKTLAKYIPIIESQIKNAFDKENFYYQELRAGQKPDTKFNDLISYKINQEILLPLQNKISEELQTQNNMFDYDESTKREERMSSFCSN
ncbi:MAG: hypothetical protein AB7U85_00855 [Alphaproteobacteria bacterium]